MKKILREIVRFYSKLTDYFLLTQNFHKYQIKYSGIYSNSYKLKKEQFSLIHPPKSAGTSISEHLRKNNINTHVSAHNLVSKHCNPEQYKYITIVRNPITRLKSFYEMQLYNKKLPFHFHSKKGMNYFIKNIKINQNCLCKFILGNLNKEINEEIYPIVEKNLNNFWFVLNFENLEKDVEILSKKLNISSKLVHIGKKKVEKKLEYTAEDINIIENFNKYDLRLYNYFINKSK
jgi:hypothetical protein